MLRRHAQLRTAIHVAGDAASTATALGIAYFVRFHSGLLETPKPWIPMRYLQALPVALLLCLATYAVVGCYRPPRGGDRRGARLRSAVGGVLPFREAMGAVLAAAAALLIVAGALFYGVGGEYQYSRAVLLLFPLLGVPLFWAGRRASRLVLSRFLRRGIGVRRAVLAGRGEAVEVLVRRIEESPWTGIRVVGRVADPEEIPAAIQESGAEQVFLAWPAADHRDLARSVELLEHEMIDVRIVPDLPARPTLNQEASFLGGLPVITVRETPFHGLSRILKRSCDLVVGGLLLLLASPLILLCALAVLLLTGRPIFYRQERMGLDGRRFSILKFRTMRTDAEADTGAVWASRNDPRCTGVGRVLRRFSLDELPQLLNVLRGEMSLVGPRPERPMFIERFRESLPGYMLRHRIPAGLTGWAQVNGHRGETEVGTRLRFDLDYLESWSLLFDLEILLRTVWHVMTGRNAV